MMIYVSKLRLFKLWYTVYTRLLAALFIPGIWPVFCLWLIRATYPEGQSSRMSYHWISVIQSNRKWSTVLIDELPSIYHTYRQTTFWRRRFLRFWTIKLTFITFACKNQYFVVDSRRVVIGDKVNWPVAYSWIGSGYMAKISAAVNKRVYMVCLLIKIFVCFNCPCNLLHL